jgi:hypothetical protein
LEVDGSRRQMVRRRPEVVGEGVKALKTPLRESGADVCVRGCQSCEVPAGGSPADNSDKIDIAACEELALAE